MFTFNYRCGQCGYRGEETVRNAEELPYCPRCAERDLEVSMEKMPGGFNLGGQTREEHGRMRVPEIINTPLGLARHVEKVRDLPHGELHKYRVMPGQSSPELN